MIVWYLGVSEDDEYQEHPTVEAIKRVTYFALTELRLETVHHRFAKERQGWIGWKCVQAVLFHSPMSKTRPIGLDLL